MARQNGRTSFYCHCVVCLAWYGFRVIREHLDDTAYAINRMDNLLKQGHFSDREMARMQHLERATVNGLEDALDAATVLELRLGQYAGGCKTWGISTLVRPEMKQAEERCN